MTRIDTMDYLSLALSIANLSLICFGLLFLRNYIPSYLNEKGKNLATKEDIGLLTDRVERIKAQYVADVERLKSSLTLDIHVIQKRRQVYEDIAKSLRVFIAGHKTGAEGQSSFLECYAAAWLWVPDPVLVELNQFLNLMITHNNSPLPQESLREAYASVLLEMRKSAGFAETGVSKDD